MLNNRFLAIGFIAAITVFMVMSACSQQKDSQVQLPDKAAQAIGKAVPDGKITAVKKEHEQDRELFEVIVAAGDKTYEIDVTADGTIEDREEKSGVEAAEQESAEEAENETEFTFDRDPVGNMPAHWSNQKTGRGGPGQWKIVEDPSAPSKPNVLAQISKANPGYHFNLAVAEQTTFANLEIELKFKAVDGQEDQGGGPMWRYQDADNYYICRANPLESNFRLYKVVDGNRKQLQSATVDIPSNVWHTIKVKNVGNHIQCWYNGTLYLDFSDATFISGKVGLWTKADAVTWFDNVEVENIDTK